MGRGRYVGRVRPGLRLRRPSVLAGGALVAALVAAGVLAATFEDGARSSSTSAAAVAALRIGTHDLAHAGRLSRYRYVILQASAAVRPLRAANPHVKLIAYENMGFAADWSCTRGVDQRYPPGGLGYCWLAARHPGWFLTDTSGRRIQSESYRGLWFTDVGNRAYQNAWAGAVISTLRAKGFDGVMLDDANSDASGHLGDRTIASYPAPASYASATESFLRNVCRQIRSAGFLALPNVNGDAPRAVRKRWAAHCDGTVKEHWAKWGESTDLQKSGDEWLGELAQLDDAEKAGKILLPITYGPKGDAHDMTFARASFLLAWSGKGGSALVWDTPGADPWSAAWTVAVGAPLGARRLLAGGVWRRDFTGGVVLVNPSASDSATVALGAAYRGSDGAWVSSVTLRPSSAAILQERAR